MRNRVLLTGYDKGDSTVLEGFRDATYHSITIRVLIKGTCRLLLY